MSETSGKSSKRVALGALAALAVAVGAYSCNRADEETAYCVTDPDDGVGGFDGSYQVVDDDNCDDDDDYTYRSSSHGGYFWYYGGKRRGSLISGGSRVKPSGTTIRTRGGRTLSRPSGPISRGGFGGSSRVGG